MNKKWRIIKGQRPVLLVASHNYPQIREGSIKPADIGTGDIVEKLCQNTKSWGIISQSVLYDPNWYEKSEFRIEVKELINKNNIGIVLDFHGKKDSSDAPVDFYPNSAFKQRFSACLIGLSTKSFKKNDQLTLSEDIDHLGVPGLEIEIDKKTRLAGTKLYNIIVNELETLIIKLKELIFLNGTGVN
jgi:hypothetical protein